MDLEPLKIEREPRAPPSSRRRRGIKVLPIALALLAAAIGYLFRDKIARSVDHIRLPEVAVIRVVPAQPGQAGAVSGTAANGYIVARRRAALSADTPGRIVEINVEEGTVVRKGDIVARLFDDEYEASLRRAEADLGSGRVAVERARAEEGRAKTQLAEFAAAAAAERARVAEAAASLQLSELSFARAEKLVAERVVSQEHVDEARSELERSRAQVAAATAELQRAQAAALTGESALAVAAALAAEALSALPVLEAARDLAQATLEKTAVRAPFDGVVVLKDAEVGEVVSPNVAGGTSTRGSVATMVDFATLEVQVEVQETSLAAVELGAPVNIYLDAWPAEAYRGRVQRIWPTANRQKGTVEVRASIENPDERLRPDMGARVVFRAEDDPASGEKTPSENGPVLLVPLESVVRIGGEVGVFLLERDVVRFRPITAGKERSGRVVVESGLSGGELVVAKPPASLDDGDRVQVPEG